MNATTIERTEEAPSAASPNLVYRGSRKTVRGEAVLPLAAPPDETLVVDDRASVTPAQAIETKLTRLLQEAWVPVSHLQMRAMVRTR